jgi:hypothetical protein
MKHMILLIGLLMTLQSTGATWVPPLGIPEPQFGINEQAPSRPAAWPGAASVDSYYIDNTHPSATDTANAYGYPNKPRMTIPDRLIVVANSLVEIHGGPYLTTTTSYAWGINSSTTNPPTSLAPAFIRGFDNVVIGASQAAINAGAQSRIDIGRTDFRYTIIEGIHFKLLVGIMGSTAHHACIRNCESSETLGCAMGVGPFEAGTIHDIVFYNNRIHDTAYWDSIDRDWDYHGIGIDTYGRTAATSLYNVWVLDNTFYHCSGDSVQVNASTAGHAALHHVYIGRNTAYANRQSGFWVKQASHVIISQNVIHTMTEHGPQPGNGIGSQYGSDNLWIIFNEIYDCAFGIRQSDTGAGFADHNAYYVGNYIHDANQLNDSSHWQSPSGWGISFWSGGLNRHVVDNTIVNVYGGIEMIQAGPVYGKGNLIYNLKPNEFPLIFGTYRSHIECGGDGVNVDFVNCLLYGNAGGASQLARVKWLGTQYTTLSSARTALGKLANCVEAAPLMNGVKLQANSPAIDAGTQSDVYQKFQDLYGINIRRGFNGGVRPSGAGWDIGACEYDHAPIPAPKGFRQEPLPR